jgi:hypothetical protein
MKIHVSKDTLSNRLPVVRRGQPGGGCQERHAGPRQRRGDEVGGITSMIRYTGLGLVLLALTVSLLALALD